MYTVFLIQLLNVQFDQGSILWGGSFLPPPPPPQTLQLPPKKFWPVTYIEVTTILVSTLFRCQYINVRCEGVHYLEYACTRCAAGRNVIAYYYEVWGLSTTPTINYTSTPKFIS